MKYEKLDPTELRAWLGSQVIRQTEIRFANLEARGKVFAFLQEYDSLASLARKDELAKVSAQRNKLHAELQRIKKVKKNLAKEVARLRDIAFEARL